MIIQLGLGLHLLPIVPLLLLPFAIIFFVVVFPIWALGLAVLGSLLLICRGINAITRGGFAGPTNGVYKAFRWVLTFAGFTEKFKQAYAERNPGA